MSRAVAFCLFSLLTLSLVACNTRPQAATVRRPAEPRVTGSSVHLVVIAGPGVTGPLTQDTSVATGTRLHYAFATKPRYRNLAVELDGVRVGDSGTIEMSQSRLLMVSADAEAVVNPADSALLASARSILTSADPVAAYQQYIEAVAALFDAVGEEEAVRRLREVHFASYDPIADSAAIRRVDEALGGKVFEMAPAATRRKEKAGPAQPLPRPKAP